MLFRLSLDNQHKRMDQYQLFSGIELWMAKGGVIHQL